MAKLPYMQFYPADYQADVRRLAMATQGAWMQILCVLWRSPKKGQLTLTLDEWARELGCSSSDLSLYLTDLEHHHVGKITRELIEDVERITIVSKRMVREKLKQIAALKRKRKQRDEEMSRTRHAPVPQKSHPGHAEESEIRNQKSELREEEEKNKTPLTPQGGLVVLDDFELFWKAYPKKIGKEAARRAWRKLGSSRPVLEIFLQAIRTQKDSLQWQRENGQFIPHPATWLNQGRWADEPIPANTIQDPNGMLAGINAFLARN